MIIGRFETSILDEGRRLPKKWTEEFTKVLTETYFDQSEKDNCFFDVYGAIFKEEFLVVVSYIHHDDLMASPISLFLSHNNLEDSKKFDKTLQDLPDLTGMIFDDIFSITDWNDYSPVWTENKFKQSNFFYKITRENMSLTLQAEEFLNHDIFKQEK